MFGNSERDEINMANEEAWEERRRAKIQRGLDDGEYVIKNGIVVCSMCGGNCGQCGNTETLGNVPMDFRTMVTNAVEGTRLTSDKPSLWSRIKRVFV